MLNTSEAVLQQPSLEPGLLVNSPSWEFVFKYLFLNVCHIHGPLKYKFVLHIKHNCYINACHSNACYSNTCYSNACYSTAIPAIVQQYPHKQYLPQQYSCYSTAILATAITATAIPVTAITVTAIPATAEKTNNPHLCGQAEWWLPEKPTPALCGNQSPNLPYSKGVGSPVVAHLNWWTS